MQIWTWLWVNVTDAILNETSHFFIAYSCNLALQNTKMKPFFNQYFLSYDVLKLQYLLALALSKKYSVEVARSDLYLFRVRFTHTTQKGHVFIKRHWEKDTLFVEYNIHFTEINF